jgi:hypothetical protein
MLNYATSSDMKVASSSIGSINSDMKGASSSSGSSRGDELKGENFQALKARDAASK